MLGYFIEVNRLGNNMIKPMQKLDNLCKSRLVIWMLLFVIPVALITGLIIKFMDLFDFIEINKVEGGD